MTHHIHAHHNPEELLEVAGIRPTVNRILVARELLAAENPLSMMELEEQLETLEKSSIFRVLTLLLEHGLVHAIEDGRGIVKYEICHGDGSCSPADMHPHFYCEKCKNVYCFEHLSIPEVALPEGYSLKSINFMMKGICPKCQ